LSSCNAAATLRVSSIVKSLDQALCEPHAAVVAKCDADGARARSISNEITCPPTAPSLFALPFNFNSNEMNVLE
jgi:hypothetical protein